jgi:hypothetical protein
MYKLERTPILTPSPPYLDNPTPMPSLHTDNYFTPRTRSPSPARSEITQSVNLLQRVLADTASVRQASTAAFLRWRSIPPPAVTPEHNLSSSQSSIATRTSEDVSPLKTMPTVARAQGGKEWEASLSRRIARTRRGSRKSSKNCAPGYGPLFPGNKGSGRGVADVGLGRFQAGKERIKGLWSGWGFVGVAALVVAVGLGCWVKFK